MMDVWTKARSTAVTASMPSKVVAQKICDCQKLVQMISDIHS